MWTLLSPAARIAGSGDCGSRRPSRCGRPDPHPAVAGREARFPRRVRFARHSPTTRRIAASAQSPIPRRNARLALASRSGLTSINGSTSCSTVAHSSYPCSCSACRSPVQSTTPCPKGQEDVAGHRIQKTDALVHGSAVRCRINVLEMKVPDPIGMPPVEGSRINAGIRHVAGINA